MIYQEETIEDLFPNDDLEGHNTMFGIVRKRSVENKPKSTKTECINSLLKDDDEKSYFGKLTEVPNYNLLEYKNHKSKLLEKPEPLHNIVHGVQKRAMFKEINSDSYFDETDENQTKQNEDYEIDKNNDAAANYYDKEGMEKKDDKADDDSSKFGDKPNEEKKNVLDKEEKLKNHMDEYFDDVEKSTIEEHKKENTDETAKENEEKKIEEKEDDENKEKFTTEISTMRRKNINTAQATIWKRKKSKNKGNHFSRYLKRKQGMKHYNFKKRSVERKTDIKKGVNINKNIKKRHHLVMQDINPKMVNTEHEKEEIEKDDYSFENARIAQDILGTIMNQSSINKRRLLGICQKYLPKNFVDIQAEMAQRNLVDEILKSVEDSLLESVGCRDCVQIHPDLLHFLNWLVTGSSSMTCCIPLDKIKHNRNFFLFDPHHKLHHEECKLRSQGKTCAPKAKDSVGQQAIKNKRFDIEYISEAKRRMPFRDSPDAFQFGNDHQHPDLQFLKQLQMIPSMVAPRPPSSAVQPEYNKKNKVDVSKLLPQR